MKNGNKIERLRTKMELRQQKKGRADGESDPTKLENELNHSQQRKNHLEHQVEEKMELNKKERENFTESNQFVSCIFLWFE